MCVDDYLRKYPGAATLSAALLERLQPMIDPGKPRQGIRPGDPIKVKIAGISHSLHLGVPASACLPAPANYKPPTLKQAGRDFFHLSVALTSARATYVQGPTGSGKDAALHYFSAATHRPTLLVQIIPGVDLKPWISYRSFRDNVPVWEEGSLVRAVRDGYGPGRIPYLIVFTDIDRAEADQLEHLRMMLDSISGRVQTLDGKMHTVLPGTQFVATANTVGSGDGAAMYVSAKPQDLSMLGRFSVKLEWHDPEIDDVLPQVKEAFPILTEGTFFQTLRVVMQGIRLANVRTTGVVFSMRDVFAVCEHAQRLVRDAGWKAQDSTTLFLGALRVWLGGLAEDQKSVVRSLLQTHLGSNLPSDGDMP